MTTRANAEVSVDGMKHILNAQACGVCPDAPCARAAGPQRQSPTPNTTSGRIACASIEAVNAANAALGHSGLRQRNHQLPWLTSRQPALNCAGTSGNLSIGEVRLRPCPHRLSPIPASRPGWTVVCANGSCAPPPVPSRQEPAEPTTVPGAGSNAGVPRRGTRRCQHTPRWWPRTWWMLPTR